MADGAEPDRTGLLRVEELGRADLDEGAEAAGVEALVAVQPTS